MAAPAVLAADNAPLTGSQFHAAYCAGFYAARQQALGDECFEAAAGWENQCSADEHLKDQYLAFLAQEQSMSNEATGPAIVSGQMDYKQCISEEAARLLACQKQGAQAGACKTSAPACERLSQCEE